ncbi:LysM peptidoglycan-binding domain-containing protein [Devosia sp. 2618]|uniref:LysM peptidoglycan-binding domain-containing protein n=1 Tax=Devosia sp. 2618 TaxID=3156454 RepID=UPI003398581B
MGYCLRGKMVESGILPAPAVAETETPAAVETAAVVSPEPAAAVGEPALDVTPPAADPVPQNLIAATFGLLRAEPDGSVVIAGSGTPGTEVEVYSNGDLLGKTTVESSGDWVLVPDAPIAPGGTEITLAEAGKTGTADKSFVVVIDDDKTTQPLVVASTPGAASQVLQGLERPAITPPTQVAAADPVTPPAPPVAVEPTPAPVPPTEAPAPVAATEPAPAIVPPAAPEPVQAARTPEPTPAVAPPPVAVVAPEPAPVAQNDGPTEPVAAPAAVEPIAAPPAAAGTDTAVAAANTAAPTPATKPAVVSVAPTIDAIEIEGGRTFFAGGGTEGATVRLYVDDSFIADAIISGGRWLIEAGNVLTKAQQRVRIDLLQPDKTTVASRAEVNFTLDIPATAVAAAPAVTPPAPVAAAQASTTAPTPATRPEPAAPETAAATPPAQVETPPAVEPTPTAPAVAEVVPAQTEDAIVPTLAGVAVGDDDAQRFAAGKAIIRRGDNLWSIARRVYGEGIKYTTIYEANTGQIRDPDRIYPGQVFDLPK